MRYAIILLFIMTMPTIGFSATINIPADFPTIQQGIDAAMNGDTVLVAPGTYVENIDFKGNAILVKSLQGPEGTVIDGNKAGSVVAFQSGEGLDSILDGFSVTNGSGTYIPNFEYVGGGIYCEGSSPTITNSIIRFNEAHSGGGIAVIFNASPYIVNNTITKNLASFYYDTGGGGGLVIGYDSSPLIKNNVISHNSANSGGSGGGIGLAYNSAPIIENNLIIGNSSVYRNAGGIGAGLDSSGTIKNNIICENWASEGGGGIGFSINSHLVISNNLIHGNSADVGGGICLWESSSAAITNNTIYGNIVADKGGGIFCNKGCSVVVANTILWNNGKPTIEGPEIWIGGPSYLLPTIFWIKHSNVKGGWSSMHVGKGGLYCWGPGMIDEDPFFVDEANRDFHLTFNSPCKDTGANNVVTELYDFEGDPRDAYGTVDMGADEFYTHLYWTGHAMPGGNVEVKFVGLPGTSPVGLCIGTGVLDPPLKSMWGDWYLQFPILGPIDMPSIPKTGVLAIPGTIPGTPPAPYSIPMQALIGAELTSLSLMEVK